TYLSTALVTIGVKQHYSHATVADLAWILAPTATVVGWLRRQPLVLDASLGWVAPDGSFVIAPACAGINFLILVFIVGVLGFVDRRRPSRQRGRWCGRIAGIAYLLTIAVNTLRIVIAASLYAADVQAGWLTPERLHRLAGATIYLGALWAVWIALDRLSARWRCRPAWDCPKFAVALCRDYLRNLSPNPSPTRRGEPKRVQCWRSPFPRREGGEGVRFQRDDCEIRTLPSASSGVRSLLVPGAYLGMTVVLPLLNGAWQQ